MYMKSNDYKKDNNLDKIINLNVNLKQGNNLLQYKVIDLLIHNNNHYSRMFIVNPEMVINGMAKVVEKHWMASDTKACMIHIDSLSVHKLERIAKVVKKFLNQYAKSKNVLKNFFNVNLFPVYKVDGKESYPSSHLDKMLIQLCSHPFSIQFLLNRMVGCVVFILFMLDTAL